MTQRSRAPGGTIDRLICSLGQVLYVFGFLIFFAVTAWGRMGESHEECQNRYGMAVTNYPGYGHLADVVVYLKDGVYVIAFFTKATSDEPRVGMIFYSRLPPHIKGILLPPPEINQKEEAVLMATVPGRWQTYDPPPSLARGSGQSIPLSQQPAITIRRRDAAAEAVREAVTAIYCTGLTRLWADTPLAHIAHNGARMFAFRVSRGLAICSYEAADSIGAWAGRILSEKANAEKPPEKELTGF